MDFQLKDRRILLNGALVATVSGDSFSPTKEGRKYRLELAEFFSRVQAEATIPQVLEDKAVEGLKELIEEAKAPAPVQVPEGAVEWDKAPPMDPELGDKTPAFVDWLHRLYPKEFARRYKDRKTHLNHA